MKYINIAISNPKKELYLIEDDNHKYYLAIKNKGEDIKRYAYIDDKIKERIKESLTSHWHNRRKGIVTLIDIHDEEEHKVGNIEIKFHSDRWSGDRVILSLEYYTGDDDFFGRSIETEKAHLNIVQSRVLYKYLNNI